MYFLHVGECDTHELLTTIPNPFGQALELHLNISLQKAVATLEDEINSLREAVRETSGKDSSHTGAHLNLRDIDDEGSVADPKW